MIRPGWKIWLVTNTLKLDNFYLHSKKKKRINTLQRSKVNWKWSWCNWSILSLYPNVQTPHKNGKRDCLQISLL